MGAPTVSSIGTQQIVMQSIASTGDAATLQRGSRCGTSKYEAVRRWVLGGKHRKKTIKSRRRPCRLSKASDSSAPQMIARNKRLGLPTYSSSRLKGFIKGRDDLDFVSGTSGKSATLSPPVPTIPCGPYQKGPMGWVGVRHITEVTYYQASKLTCHVSSFHVMGSV